MAVKKALVWDLSPLFAGDNDKAISAARQNAQALTTAFAAKWQERADYLADPVVLAEALVDYEAWILGDGGAAREQYYFGLRQAQDSISPVLKAKGRQAEEFGKQIANQIQFFTLRLAKVSKEVQTKLLTAPALAPYRHFLEALFAEQAHLLSEPEEKIMLLKTGVSYGNWVEMTSNFLDKETATLKLKNKKELVPFPVLSSLTSNPHKPTRDQAARAFQTIVNKHLETAEAELNSILENKKINDELRHYARPDAARHLSDDLESGIVDTALEAIRQDFAVSQRYYKLKAKLLGVKQLAYHERNVPYGKIEAEYSYEQAVGLVGKVVSDLKPEWGLIFQKFVSNRQIDVLPRRGKSDGAFCAGEVNPAFPTYILLNHTGRLRDVLTLAHEFGHGLNNELMKRDQNPLNYGSPLSTAEVASTFMEDFVLAKVLEGVDDKTRLVLLIDKLNEDISTIHRQTACYLFEKELHQEFRAKGYLPKEQIGRLFQKHMKAYMGPAVRQDPGAENWWVYWSHIRNFFYVYSYATGLIVAKALQAGVRRDRQFVDRVDQFLGTGSSQSPRQIFAGLGLDISTAGFWQAGLTETKNLLAEAERLAKKLGH